MAVGLAALIFLWAAVNLAFGWASFDMQIPRWAERDASVANLIAKLFGTLAILLLAADSERQRRRWLTVCFLSLTFGQMVTKFLEPVTIGTLDLSH